MKFARVQLLRKPAVGAASTVAAGTPFRRSEHPVCQSATGSTVFLDRSFPLRVREFTFVDEEGLLPAAAFAFEDVRGHRKARL